ncbi:MAG: proton-conducting transporter membrane subunit [Planctomycetales bacterium]
MLSWLSGSILVLPALLLACGLIPRGLANRRPRDVYRLVLGLILAALAVALVAPLVLARQGVIETVLARAEWPLDVTLGIHYDNLAAVMFLLISFIGCVIVHFSRRYLAGEQTQGRFLAWVGFTLGAVLLLVVSRNLVMFTGAWMLTSLGLHQLLTHYADRPAAILAARKKFVISRLGDLMLLGALALTYQSFSTLEYSALFEAARAWQATGAPVDATTSLIGTLFVLGAMTKSAQVPVHSWLPDTMEAPTPVSALMHAGIINAGGFLVIRLSPLVSLSHLALDLLAVVGGVTALIGGLAMMTQTSIKRALAYSTIAQMGFMMLQCGLGAFSGALLHIVAHALYKAYAFLNSGENPARDWTAAAQGDPGITTVRDRWLLPLAGGAALAICLGFSTLLETLLPDRPGTLVLELVLVLALTQLLWNAWRSWRWPVAAAGLASAAALCLSYHASYFLMDRLLAGSVAHKVVASWRIDILLQGTIMAGFVALFVLLAAREIPAQSPLFRRFYVHALNGFYVDLAAHRLVAHLAGQRQATQPRPQQHPT